MRELTPTQVMTILIQRTEKRADALEAVRLSGYDMAVVELRNVARWMRTRVSIWRSRADFKQGASLGATVERAFA